MQLAARPGSPHPLRDMGATWARYAQLHNARSIAPRRQRREQLGQPETSQQGPGALAHMGEEEDDDGELDDDYDGARGRCPE